MHREVLQVEGARRIGRFGCMAASGLPAKSVKGRRVAAAAFIIVSMAALLFGASSPVHARDGDAQETPVCLRLFSPFDSDDRRSMRSIRIRAHDGYGAYRRGHLHSGLDLVGKPKERVYAIGAGRVVGFVGVGVRPAGRAAGDRESTRDHEPREQGGGVDLEELQNERRDRGEENQHCPATHWLHSRPAAGSGV